MTVEPAPSVWVPVIWREGLGGRRACWVRRLARASGRVKNGGCVVVSVMLSEDWVEERIWYCGKGMLARAASCVSGFDGWAGCDKDLDEDVTVPSSAVVYAGGASVGTASGREGC